MTKRKKIGLLFIVDESWAGGMYYVLNLIKAFNFLPDGQRPILTIFYNNLNTLSYIKEINYPFINYKPVNRDLTLVNRIKLKLKRVFLGEKKYFLTYNNKLVDFIFPCDYYFESILGLSAVADLKRIYWIPDFQHKHLPHLFKPKDIQFRDEQIENIVKTNSILILSSNDSFNDLKNFFPSYKNKVKVLHFSSILPNFEALNFELLKDKFKIGGNYFISPNQFWKHKNHIIILKALKILKKKYDINIIFTGKQHDDRNPGYFEELEDYIKDNQLEKNVSFLGFIDRREQLLLMKNSLAVIQPSLFEGWSTVVEDSKALNKYIILSNIKVHIEQCTENVSFFYPHDENSLAEKIISFMENNIGMININYEGKIKEFAEGVLKLDGN